MARTAPSMFCFQHYLVSGPVPGHDLKWPLTHFTGIIKTFIQSYVVMCNAGLPFRDLSINGSAFL